MIKFFIPTKTKELIIVGEQYLCLARYANKTRFFIKQITTISFLGIKFSSKTNVRNLIQINEETVINFVIYFYQESAIQKFLDENKQNINDNGQYTGGISTVNLNNMYEDTYSDEN